MFFIFAGNEFEITRYKNAYNIYNHNYKMYYWQIEKSQKFCVKKLKKWINWQPPLEYITI